jgi:hypothetical protein
MSRAQILCVFKQITARGAESVSGSKAGKNGARCNFSVVGVDHLVRFFVTFTVLI